MERDELGVWKKANQLRLDFMEWLEIAAGEGEEACKLFLRWVFLAVGESMEKELKMEIIEKWLQEMEEEDENST